MTFDISFLSGPSIREDGWAYAVGTIQGDGLEDYFRANLDYWTQKNYEDHWQKAIKRIVETGRPTALITDMSDPSTANFITWWPMWRLGEEVRMQNQILFLDELDAPFNIADPFSSLTDYNGNLTEEGQRISEWRIPITEMIHFLQSKDRGLSL